MAHKKYHPKTSQFVYTLCLCTAISQNKKENDKVPLLEDTEPLKNPMHSNPLTVGTSNKVRNLILNNYMCMQLYTSG